jgi:hypothetical protein
MAESPWHLGMYSWSCCCIRQRWDESSTRVQTIRCVWAPAAMSLHARFLRSPLPEALGRQERRDGLPGGEILAAHANRRVEK